VREGKFTKEKTCIAIHDNIVRYCQGITGGVFLPRVGKVGKVGRIVSPHRRGMGGGFSFRGFPLLSPAVPPWKVRFRVACHCALTLSASEGHHSGRLIKAPLLAV
jgi:hypothetical protein